MAIRYAVVLFAGLVLGFSGAALMGRTRTLIVRKDAVTLERRDLAHVLNAIQLIKDKPAGRTYTRYESNSGRVAFECPTNKACNLEIPAAPREHAPELQVTSIQETAPLPVSPVADGGPQVVSAPAAATPPANAYDRLGIKNGDVVVEVNSQKIATPDEAISAVNKLKADNAAKAEGTDGRDGQSASLKTAQ